MEEEVEYRRHDYDPWVVKAKKAVEQGLVPPEVLEIYRQKRVVEDRVDWHSLAQALRVWGVIR